MNSKAFPPSFRRGFFYDSLGLAGGEVVKGYAVDVGELAQDVKAGEVKALFPFVDALRRYADQSGKLPLCHVRIFAQVAESF